MAGESFRILAVRLTEGCSKSILKCLKPDTTYFLYEGYEDDQYSDGKWKGIKKKVAPKNTPIPENYFSVSHIAEGPTINISAIVGKNGCGKSSCAMIILRILYNFHNAVNGNTSKMIEGLKASMVFESGGNLYLISVMGCDVSAKKLTKTGWKSISTANRNLANIYTIASDYSVYSYIPDDFLEESNGTAWVAELFHITDKYETPICLMPTRTDNGFIDIVADRNMCKQRLLAVLCDAGDDDSLRIMNEGKTAIGYETKLEDDPKIVTKLIRPLIEKEDYDFFGIRGRSESMDVNGRAHITDSEWRDEKQFWERYADKWEKYHGLIELMCFESKNHRLERIINNSNPLFDYLNMMPAMIQADGYGEDARSVLDSMNSLRTIIGNGRLSTYLFQRAVFLIDICEIWNSKYKGLIDEELEDDAFAKAFENYYYEKFGEHQDKFRKQYRGKKFLQHKRIPNVKASERDHAFMYISYKTFSIFQKYSPWNNWLPFSDDYGFMVTEYYDNNPPMYYEGINIAFTYLIQCNKVRDIYYTVKLRQTINFLRYNTFDSSKTRTEFKDLHERIEHAKTASGEGTISLLPPPIFHGDIVIEDKNDNKNKDIRFRNLSSGEQQLFLSLYSILYHLKNIDYGKDKVEDGQNMVKGYEHVNLIMEEVELYFHPEYQRQFVHSIVDILKRSNLKNIKGINIIMVTHSPFILSDLPKSNVLFLERGEQKMKEIDTLGANIHEMLGDSFFMENTIGDHTVRKINEIISLEDRCGKNDDRRDQLQEEYNSIKEDLIFLASTVSDTYLRKSLQYSLKDLEDYFTNKPTDELSRLREERERLKQELAKADDRIKSLSAQKDSLKED